MTTTHRDHYVPKEAPVAPPVYPSRVTLALPLPAQLTTTARDHFPEQGSVNTGGNNPPPRKPRVVPFVGSTEHRDEYTPVRMLCLECNTKCKASRFFDNVLLRLQKKALSIAAIPAPDYALEELCPAIPLMSSIPGPASPSWRGDHVLFDTMQGGWTMGRR